MPDAPALASPVYELLWTIVGAALALVATQLLRTFGADDAPPSTEPPPNDAAEAVEAPLPPPNVVTTQIATEARSMAVSLAEELASLVSAVEGRAHHLIEAAPTRSQLPAAAEAFLASVERLRTLHTKLLAFGDGRADEGGNTDVVELIAGLGDELQQMQLGLELRWEPPPELPLVDADRTAVRDSLLFVCAALLRAERGATRLTFSAERSFAREHPAVEIELNLEWIDGAGAGDRGAGASDHIFTLDLEAARQLLHAYGGDLTLSHLPGKSVRAVVGLPMAVPVDAEPAVDDRPEPSEEPAEAPVDAAVAHEAEPPEVPAPQVEPPEPAHDFGGALVLESDAALRAVLARELKASGRAVFACADGASAHTFLQATPDRFELLIVDDVQQLAAHTPLARTIRDRAPDLKICLMTPAPPEAQANWPTLHCLRKPFGVHELRRTLASILAVAD